MCDFLYDVFDESQERKLSYEKEIVCIRWADSWIRSLDGFGAFRGCAGHWALGVKRRIRYGERLVS
jgi:hypothetical protein